MNYDCERLQAIPTEWRVPKNITIETTSRCNLRCQGCPSTRPTAPHIDINLDFFKSIIDRVYFPTIIVPYANGEPTLHPQIHDMMDYVLQKDLRTYLTSNMTLFDEKLWKRCLEAPSYYQTIISLDGLSSPASRSIELARPGSDRARIIGNVFRYIDLSEQCEARTDKHTELGIKICHRGQDWEEIEQYISRWLREPGIDFVILGEMLLYDSTPGMRIYPCQYSDDVFMMIRANGQLVLCMYNDAIVNGLENPMGQLNTMDDLLTVYNNAAYTRFREDQQDGVFTGPCKTCGFAFTGVGLEGQVQFRNEALSLGQPIYYHRDYYNHFFSKKRKIRKNTFYGYAWEAHPHLAEYAKSEIQYEETQP